GGSRREIPPCRHLESQRGLAVVEDFRLSDGDGRRADASGYVCSARGLNSDQRPARLDAVTAVRNLRHEVKAVSRKRAQEKIEVARTGRGRANPGIAGSLTERTAVGVGAANRRRASRRGS